MPGPLSTPHGHRPNGSRVNGKSAMRDAGVHTCRSAACPTGHPTTTATEEE